MTKESKETKKQKIIIREIKPKIKVREITEEEKELEKQGKTDQEQSLEDITSDAPSGREFPEFSRLRANLPEQQIQEVPTPAATTEAENVPRGVYQIQQNISETEIGRIYQSRAAVVSRSEETRPTVSLIPEQQPRTFISRDIESARIQSEEEKYTAKIEQEAPTKRKRYPWEA